MVHLHLDARVLEGNRNLLKNFALECPGVETLGGRPIVLADSLDGVGGLEENELDLEADEKLHIGLCLCLAVPCMRRGVF